MTVGLTRRKYIYGRTRQEISRKLAVATRTRDDGLPLPPERETIGSYLTTWLDGQRSRLRPRTWQGFEQLIRLHALPALGRVPMNRLAPQHLEKLYAERRLAGQSASSVHHLHMVLHKACEQAVRWNLMPRNVVHLVDPPRTTGRAMTVLSPAQVRVLLDAAFGGPLEALLIVAVSTGMRKGELLALRWHDLDLDAGVVHISGTLQRNVAGERRIREPKTARSRRQVELTAVAVDALRRHRLAQTERRLLLGAGWNDHDLVFPSSRGLPQDGSHLLYGQFHSLLRSAGLPMIRFHDLRHTAATLMLGRSVHPKIGSEMLGHSTIAITLDLYSHVTPTMQRAAAAAMNDVLVGQ